ncbi:MAG: 1-acyl-sn-glycerol-3-phosphate acyltransferase [Gammaproteobacteria bacterium]
MSRRRGPLARFAGGLLRLLGWRLLGPMPELEKSVVIAAPHTSNWDVPILIIAGLALGVRVHVLIKHTAFWWPLGAVLRRLGGIPVDRRRPRAAVRTAVRAFREKPAMHLALAPEGTRSLVRYWKKGFYFMAMEAGVPIVMATIDFKRREVGVMGSFQPCGDPSVDMAVIRRAYTGIVARHPERMGPIELPALIGSGEHRAGVRPGGTAEAGDSRRRSRE